MKGGTLHLRVADGVPLFLLIILWLLGVGHR